MFRTYAFTLQRFAWPHREINFMLRDRLSPYAQLVDMRGYNSEISFNRLSNCHAKSLPKCPCSVSFFSLMHTPQLPRPSLARGVMRVWPPCCACECLRLNGYRSICLAGSSDDCPAYEARHFGFNFLICTYLAIILWNVFLSFSKLHLTYISNSGSRCSRYVSEAQKCFPFRLHILHIYNYTLRKLIETSYNRHCIRF